MTSKHGQDALALIKASRQGKESHLDPLVKHLIDRGFDEAAIPSDARLYALAVLSQSSQKPKNAADILARFNERGLLPRNYQASVAAVMLLEVLQPFLTSHGSTRALVEQALSAEIVPRFKQLQAPDEILVVPGFDQTLRITVTGEICQLAVKLPSHAKDAFELIPLQPNMVTELDISVSIPIVPKGRLPKRFGIVVVGISAEERVFRRSIQMKIETPAQALARIASLPDPQPLPHNLEDDAWKQPDRFQFRWPKLR